MTGAGEEIFILFIPVLAPCHYGNWKDSQLRRGNAPRRPLPRTEEEYLTRETFKLRTKLSEAEADRNLLMATLRQEGLLGNYRSRETGKSPHLGDSESASAESDSAENGGENAAQPRGAATGGRKQCYSTSTQKRGREPLHAVLEDLQNIAAKVLEDEDEDEDEDEEG
ncbi:uncharacterized protein [Diadema setosum]|uniref:uncharacterized protein n=1 Tax=Diadema setosum TaxID=31175 RepID=UPI003B39FE84